MIQTLTGFDFQRSPAPPSWSAPAQGETIHTGKDITKADVAPSIVSMDDKSSWPVSGKGDCRHVGKEGSFQRPSRHCHNRLNTSIRNTVARRQLLSVTLLCLVFMVTEAVGGVLSNSIALFTDVLHLGSDLINFSVCLLAQWLAQKPATRRMSYGYLRAEVLGALFTVILIWIVSGVLVQVAVSRIIHGLYTEVRPDEMVITASLGLLFNLIMGSALTWQACGGLGHSNGLLGHDHSNTGRKTRLPEDKIEAGATQDDESNIQSEGADTGSTDKDRIINLTDRKIRNISVKAAFFHVIGDTMQSIGVLLAAIVIKFGPNETYRLADPICTIIFSLVVLTTTIIVLKDVILIIMEGVPVDISLKELKQELGEIQGVLTTHSLHVWALTLDKSAMSVHLAIDYKHTIEEVLTSAIALVQDKYQFHVFTIQVELYTDAMRTCEECIEFN